MTLGRCATYGQLFLFVVLLIGIAHLLGGGARVSPVPGPGSRPGRTSRALLSVLRI
ncbi:hypothetical protein [Streptomyces sp. NPDC058092]|uniref:hypothetical protein n=1 Tax=Streptomyces sp. NPDC058092 TaxID=3346336 RepID=UPI0036EF40C5